MSDPAEADPEPATSSGATATPDDSDIPPSPWWRHHRRVLLAAAGGAVAALATPPIDLFPCMPLGLALLAAAIRDAPSGWRGFGLGALWGTTGGLVAMRFVPSVITLFTDLGTPVAWLAHILLSAAQSLHWALGMGVAVLLMRHWHMPRLWAFPLGVWLALLMPGLFVWSPAGLMSPWPVLLQSASWIGERGVSALLASVACLLAMAIEQARRHGWRTRAAALPGALSLLIIAAMLLHGQLSMARYGDGEQRVRIALVQGAVHPKRRWQREQWPHILRELRAQTAAAEAQQVELTVWPEAAYPYPLLHDATRMPAGRRGVLGSGVVGPVLFGFLARAPIQRNADGSVERNSYNAATIIDRHRILQPSYDKMELLLFGEAVPLADELPWLRRMFQRSGGLIPGNDIRALRVPRDGVPRDGVPSLQIAVMNCYEDTIPGLGRRLFGQVQPNLLVNVTNDAWFVGTEEPELHLRLAVMRSIELRRDTVRSVNLGVAGWIDAAGRVRLRASDDKPSFVIAEPTLRNAPATVYARYGETPMLFLFVLSGVALRFRRRR